MTMPCSLIPTILVVEMPTSMPMTIFFILVYISKWETGKSYPSLENLSKISETYGVSINEILAGTRLGMNEKEIVSDENLLKEMQKTKVNRIAVQIIFVISLCTIMILLEIVCYMAGVNNIYYTMIFIIMLLFGLLVEFCIKNLK